MGEPSSAGCLLGRYSRPFVLCQQLATAWAAVSAAAPAVRLPEDDVAPVDVRHWGSDDVLEVEPSRGSLESAGAAAFSYRVVAAPFNLCPGGWVKLRLELVGCCESARGSAVQAAHEDLFAAFQVDPARRLLRCDDLRVQTAVEAARHQESGIADEVLIPRVNGQVVVPAG